MKVRRVITVTGVLALVFLVISCTGIALLEAPATEPTAPAAEEASGEWVAPEGALVAIPAETAPTLDGTADEETWANAPTITVSVENGSNMGATDVTLQSAYTSDMVYFHITWADPTESFMRSPWVKQDDGSWAKLIDPDDRGGDNNVYYEDKLSFIWPINDSIPRFARMGCFTACHDEEDDVKPYGNKYTDEEGQLGDIWHWKSVRNLGQADDQYLDSTRWSEDTPSAGRHSDPKESGGYVNNQAEDGTMPMWMGPEGYPRDGSPGYIIDAEKQEFDDSLFAAGDMIPGITKSAAVGDRGDISAGWSYTDGMWTLELGRALETGSEFDVQFSDPALPYYFGIAVFDNAQVRHAYHTRSQVLVFQP